MSIQTPSIDFASGKIYNKTKETYTLLTVSVRCDPSTRRILSIWYINRGLIGGMGEEVPYAEDCGFLNFEAVQKEDLSTAVVYLLDPETKESVTRKPYWPDGNGVFMTQYPAGEYLVLVRAFDGDGVPRGILYTNSGWVITEDIGAAVPITIQAGATMTLEPMVL